MQVAWSVLVRRFLLDNRNEKGQRIAGLFVYSERRPINTYSQR